MPKARQRFSYLDDLGTVVDAETGEHLQQVAPHTYFKPMVEFAQLVDSHIRFFQVVTTEHGLRWHCKNPPHPSAHG